MGLVHITMKRAAFAATCLVSAFAAPQAVSVARAQAAAPSCAPSGEFEYLCGVRNLEDLVQAPGTSLIIASNYNPPAGGPRLSMINTETRKATPIGITLAKKADKIYSACPGPLDLTTFNAHGVAIRAGKGGKHTLYVVNHNARESVEIFTLDVKKPEAVAAQWVGCVVLPEGASGNAVLPLKDGGFLVSKFYDTRKGPQRPQFKARLATSVVYRWAPGKGFSTIPGSETIGANGLEVSPDEQWLYETSWIDKKIIRLPLNGKGEAKSVDLDFLPDNLRPASDGTILLAGQATSIELNMACKHAKCPIDWAVAKFDPNTMTVSYLYWEKGTPAFGAATTALQIGDKIWLGTFNGDRVVIAPLPTKPLQ
jgi:hypothetical protein